MIDNTLANDYRNSCVSILTEERKVDSNNLLVLLYHGISRTRQNSILNYNGKHVFVDELSVDPSSMMMSS